MEEFDSKDILPFAETTFRNSRQRFGIKTDDRRRHMYLIGKTGMGKSTVQENMIVEDIYAGRGIALVDPHGDLAEKVVHYIPSYRVNDVIYFNPGDTEHPIAFNVVEQVDPEVRHLVASGLIGVFRKLWADSWGPRLEYILRNTILAILDYPGATLLAVTRMLSDKSFRKKVISKIQDPVVKSFWVNEFAGYADKFAAEAVSPIQNKVGQFLSSSLIRNIVGQVGSSINLRDVMDQNKILIMNLSKGRVGEDNSSLLGAMMITKIQLAAMSRVDIPESERKDFYLYIDEFQNFSTESFANILSEARKYRLNLIMAHQYIEQLTDPVRAAVFGNVGTMVTFRVGATDAEELIKEFTPTFTEEDILNLPKFEMCLKLMIDGVASNPFSARGLPPLREEDKTGNLDKVIRVSREKFAKPRHLVEDKINRWHEKNDQENKVASNPSDKKKKPSPVEGQIRNPESLDNPSKGKDSDQENKRQKNTEGTGSDKGFEAVCYACKKKTRTSFQPDGIRPVYCPDCLKLVRQEKQAEKEERKKAKQKELEKLGGSGQDSEGVNEKKQDEKNNSSGRERQETESSGEVELSSLNKIKPINFKK